MPKIELKVREILDQKVAEMNRLQAEVENNKSLKREIAHDLIEPLQM